MESATRYTEGVISRRALLAAGVALAGCRKKRSTGFPGYAFVANEEGKAVAAVDLTAFAVIRHIRLDAEPADVLSSQTLPSVYALTPSTGTIHEIPADHLVVRRKVSRGVSAISMRLQRDRLLVLYNHPRRLSVLETQKLAPATEIALPGDPLDFDVTGDGRASVISFGREGRVALADLDTRKLRMIETGTEMGIVRFQSDGRALIAADVGRRQLMIYDVETARLITRLPLSVRPDNFCFNADGGQLFVTGEGMDAVVVVYPYHTPQVAETVLAGRAPGAMAASRTRPPYLFVANPPSGEVTIMNIRTRRVVAVAAVGAEPGYIAVTPDQQYALVLNRKSGDMGVLRIHENLANRQKSAALFTMIPVGSKPVSATIREA
jgi:DNA-binding beta-propeller fold protein YncE